MREKIAQYLGYNPRNKVIFTPAAPCLQLLDVGYELSLLIKDDLDSPHLPMIAEDCLKSLMNRSVRQDDVIGNYLAIANWGILFEPILKLNLLSLFDSFSKGNTLILVNCGVVDGENFHLLGNRANATFHIGDLHPYVLQ